MAADKLEAICAVDYNPCMAYDVEVTPEFERWYRDLDDAASDVVRNYVDLLVEVGPTLGRPYADSLHGSKISNLKELRPQAQGRPLRVFFAFDPRRVAIVLLGGDKTGDKRFYDRLIPLAEQFYDRHLRDLEKEHD